MKTNRELLFTVSKKDYRIDTFRAGGKGGQHQNKTESGVRITHIESGAVGECRNSKSQAQNKITAFNTMIKTKKFQAWLKLETARKMGVLLDIDKKVNEDLNPKNIRIEVKDNEVWKETSEDKLTTE